MTIQLDMFHCEVETLREELEKQKKEIGNVRRGLFARHSDMAKTLLAIREELSELKGYIGYKPQQTEIIELMEYAN